MQRAEIVVGGHAKPSKHQLSDGGVIVDNRLNFNSDVDYACEKAMKAINAVVRIILNSDGPSSSKGRLLASVSSSDVRHGCPAWIAALTTKRNQVKLNIMFTMRVPCRERVQNDMCIGTI